MLERVPIKIDGDQRSARPDPMFARVTISGPGPLVEAIRPEDITVSVDASTAGKGRVLTPVVILSPAYADRVLVRSVEPKTVRLR